MDVVAQYIENKSIKVNVTFDVARCREKWIRFATVAMVLIDRLVEIEEKCIADSLLKVNSDQQNTYVVLHKHNWFDIFLAAINQFRFIMPKLHVSFRYEPCIDV